MKQKATFEQLNLKSTCFPGGIRGGVTQAWTLLSRTGIEEMRGGEMGLYLIFVFNGLWVHLVNGGTDFSKNQTCKLQ